VPHSLYKFSSSSNHSASIQHHSSFITTVRNNGKQRHPFDLIVCSLPWRHSNNGAVLEYRGGREKRGSSNPRQFVLDEEIQTRDQNQRWEDASV